MAYRLPKIIIEQFNNRIYNFTSVLNNNKIVVICEKSVPILYKNLVELKSIKHGFVI